ncbi:2,3-diaminopropionate biosynthesis protein SbnB [Cohnella xylanilytica]|uniref:2,3-diaminopropionate biosynthesis protein SbnB n=1 Tax=Cohnella xylanilytica TaxID=557555 RepID=A0A841U1J9_9BACL|nr:2,3-diaminopropionate biosynthesis protein SbnB [Cohnella xylanilytica]MBB6691804.1 2,3-diaminopropionate biosynthesis protein SbnB [Cohnella xylanilytica]
MIYLDDGHIRQMGLDWPELAETIRKTALLHGTEEIAQPLKPYLRFRDPANRIIAMPAFVGGDVEACGIKWIASYPGNLGRGLPRAHSALVLNDPATGEPIAFIKGALISALRTAAVSAVMLDAWLKRRGAASFSAGIVGFGPIGRTHLSMLASLFGDRLDQVRLCDLRGVEESAIEDGLRDRTKIVSGWREAYAESDVFLTCTTVGDGYIDLPPRPGTLLLNVSLRDYVEDCVKHLTAAVVDDWTEVCRENTVIERLHLHHGWTRERSVSLKEVLASNGLDRLPPDEPVFFNPMGMAAFDIAAASYYRNKALAMGIGIHL